MVTCLASYRHIEIVLTRAGNGVERIIDTSDIDILSQWQIANGDLTTRQNLQEARADRISPK